MPQPWYAAGLAFTCTRCGNCCTGAPGFVWLSDAEVSSLAGACGLPDDQFEQVYTRAVGGRISLREKANGDCVFFESGTGCTVYDARPTQCRTWPFWEKTAGTPEAWVRTQTGCPGAGHGTLISAEEITRRIRATGM
ncbi:MAG: YkgJ family cysteine cluster protein [Gemmataceae bacterium]|nr:YkgJ family cysteine cluster protein [Gemmataceae bacterium]